MAEDRVYGGPAEAFLVYDPSLERADAPFFRQLRQEGYEPGDSRGCFGCPWCYAHLSRKRFAYGMPGVAVTQPIGGHAITLEEFWTINLRLLLQHCQSILGCLSRHFFVLPLQLTLLQFRFLCLLLVLDIFS